MTVYAKNECRVTLVVFAYNQENYIDASVNSVLAQDYPNLKVVISDDCSIDQTFERAKKLVERYTGAHVVKLRRNRQNLGLINHVNAVISEVDTELVVVAAGDDISLPHRVSKLVEVYQSSGRPKLLSSTAFRIDEAGSLLVGFAPDRVIPIDDLDLVVDSLNQVDHRVGLYLGATGAWSMDLWKKYGPIQNAHCWEDVVMGFRAALEGSYKLVDEPLVKYRVNIGLSSQGAQSLAGKVALRKSKINLKRDLARQRYSDLALSPKSNCANFSERISQQALGHSIRSAFYQSPQCVWNYFRKYPGLTIRHGLGEVKYFARAIAGAGLRHVPNALRSQK
ncbi:glycosyltransferase [bacterium]|nr:glycosyltransferase [bacterium]